jgi:hypothetical protein
MNTKPALSFSDPLLMPKKRIGIVNHSVYGESEFIWFSKPNRLIALLTTGIFLFVIFSLITFFASTAKGRIAIIIVIYTPLVLILLTIIRKLSRHNRHIELKSGKLLYIERSGDTDAVLQEISATAIHSVSSEAATASPRTSIDNQILTSPPPYVLYPSILICADPRNITITGPRRFQHKEVEFILSILNQFALSARPCHESLRS